MNALAKMFNQSKAKSAVVQVGNGRGFCVKSRGNLVIVTAAHCLPQLPPCHDGSYLVKLNFTNLLGPLEQEPSVLAECLFADPIADLAVLGSPDNQELCDKAEAYEALVGPITPLKIAKAPENGRAWLLPLDGEWFECNAGYIKHVDSMLWISKLAQPIKEGMSGSPIISDDGKAIGVVCTSGTYRGPEGEIAIASPNSRLARDLPARFLRTRRISLPL
jgi:hypothetical protein